MSQRLMRVYEFECDEPNCAQVSESYLPNRTDSNRAMEARELARADGWSVLASGRKCWCPEHADFTGEADEESQR